MKFYVCTPANLATGGPELLHQFAFFIRSLGSDCVMHYTNSNSSNPVPDQYKKYNLEYVDEITDDVNSVIIVPETLAHFLNNFKLSKKVLWWLSYDHYFIYGQKSIVNLINKFIFKHFNPSFFIKSKFPRNSNIYHYSQSIYASDMLSRKYSISAQMLTDYIDDDIINFDVDANFKRNIVAFNPKKGVEFTKKIIALAPDIEFIPIVNMTRREVIELLSISKVYIDFGYHPGRDRIPREAAIMHNCILTNRRGSANYHGDVPIPIDFKFSSTDCELIINKIHDCFENYHLQLSKFENYRSIILSQKKSFENEVLNFIDNFS